MGRNKLFVYVNVGMQIKVYKSEVDNMARAPDDKKKIINEAFTLYKNGMKLVEIASQLNVPDGTVRRWKCTYGWDGERSDKKASVRNNKKVLIDDGTELTMQNEELTEEQRLFCVYYIKSFNAVQSYMKAFGCTYKNACSHAWEMWNRVEVKKEINRLNEIKRQQVMINENDLVEFHMRIAFADMGDYVSFGWSEEPIMTNDGPVLDKDGEFVMQNVNRVTLMESQDVDTQLIKEVKQGKNGVSIKLLDRHKSLDWLDKYFIIHPQDRHRIDYENKKLSAEIREREARIKLLEKQASADNDNSHITVTIEKELEEWGG